MARITIDWRFVFLERELWALGEFLKVIEPQIQHLCKEDYTLTHERLGAAGYQWDDADLQFELNDLQDRANIVFPRLLRNPFIVTLWAAFESGVGQLAADLARTTKSKLTLNDIKGKSFLDTARKYFDAVLHTKLDTDEARLERLDDLRTLRNVVAHANGEERAVPVDKWRAVQRILPRLGSVSVYNGYLIVSAEYLSQAFQDVDGSLREAISRIRGPSLRRLDPSADTGSQSAKS